MHDIVNVLNDTKILYFKWLILCDVNFTLNKNKLVKQNFSNYSWPNEGYKRCVVLVQWEHVWKETAWLWGCWRGSGVQGGILIWVASCRGNERAPGRGNDAGKIWKSEQAGFVWGTWNFLQTWPVGQAWNSVMERKQTHTYWALTMCQAAKLRASPWGHLILPTTLSFFHSYLEWNWVWEWGNLPNVV